MSKHDSPSAQAEFALLPWNLRGIITRYLDHGLFPGHFMQAVLERDLDRAVIAAGDEEIRYIGPIYRYFALHAPYESYGRDGCVRDYCGAKWVEREEALTA